jgi:hypothetical protein
MLKLYFKQSLYALVLLALRDKDSNRKLKRLVIIGCIDIIY